MARRILGPLLVLSTALAPALAAERLPPGASSCGGCHAAPRATDAPPPLDTLSAEAIVAALAGYRTGARTGTVMPRIAKGFTEEESRAIAAALAHPKGDAP